jgi:ABC-type transporter Mla subunit MlaD
VESDTFSASTSESPALVRRLEALVERPRTNSESSLTVGPVVAASLAGLRSEMSGLDQRLAAIEGSVAALSDRIAALLQSTNSERAAAGQHRERTSEALQEQASALDEWAEAVRAGLEDLGDAVASSLGTLGDQLQDPAARDADRRHLEAMLTEVMTAVDDATRPIDDQLASLHGGILDGFAAARDRLIEDLGGTLEALERSTVATRDDVDNQLNELRSDFADAIDEVREHIETTVTTSSESVAGALADMQGEWRPRVDAVVEDGRTAARGVLSEIQAEVHRSMAELRSALDGQVAAIGNVTGYLDGGTNRLVAAGQSLLAYLGERDRMLEKERDRLLHEVLEEFAEGLSPRERRAVASRVGEAVDRRRDARDASRFRKAGDERPEPEIPAVPSLVARLAEPLPEPGPLRASAVAPRASSLRPAAKPAPAKSAATKAATKSAAKPAKATPAAVKSAAAQKLTPTKAAMGRKTTTAGAARKATTAARRPVKKISPQPDAPAVPSLLEAPPSDV